MRNIRSKGKNIGLTSICVNKKNKMGGGSIEGLECGIKMFYESDEWEFTTADDLKREMKQQKRESKEV